MKSKLFRILGVATTVAVLASMLAVVPALGMTSPTVALTASTGGVAYQISSENIYNITTTAGVAVPVNGFIEIVFPAGTNITGFLAADVSIQALAGIGGGPIAAAAPAAITITGTYPAAQTMKLTLPAAGTIGAGSLVGVTVGTLANGVINPSTAGAYTLTVRTLNAASVEIEAATTSSPYTLIVPSTEFPGTIKVFNSANILMGQGMGATAINDALALVTAAGFTLEVGPGVYTEVGPGPGFTLGASPGSAVSIYDTLTIKASGALADTVIKSNFIVWADTVTFKGLTMKSATSGQAIIDVKGSGATGANTVNIDGCAFGKYGTATTTVAEQPLVTYSNSTTSGTGKIQNCTFDSTLGDVADYCILVNTSSVGLTVSKNTFNIDNTAVAAEDTAIHVFGPVTVSENTFNGPSAANGGLAINSAANVLATVTSNTFTGLTNAFIVGAVVGPVTGGSVNFQKNTVTSCGQAYGSTLYATGKVPLAVYVTGGTITVVGNKISGCKFAIVFVYNSAAAGATIVEYNDISGNTMGMYHYSGAAHTTDLNATHNWWGVATGPTATQQTYFTTATLGVDASSPLGAAPSNGTVVLGGSNLAAKSTAAVDVDLYTSTMGTPTMDATDIIGIASFATNPGAVAPSATLTGPKYFDVSVADTDNDASIVLIKFYGTVTGNAEVWFYSSLAGTWTKCSSQAANTTSGFVAVTITTTSTPDKATLLGTPFVLAEAPPAAPPAAASTQSPLLGASNVPINTSFTWAAVTGAVSYEWQMSAEAGLTDKFSIIDDSKAPTTTACQPTENLLYNTTYHWRVRAVNSASVKGAWMTAFFTTEKEPVVVEPTPPVVIEQQSPPEITLTIPGDTVQEVQVIPAYLLWLVIAIGAVLIIAVIVLIARTRRIT
jgi:hypothetical protein